MSDWAKWDQKAKKLEDRVAKSQRAMDAANAAVRTADEALTKANKRAREQANKGVDLKALKALAAVVRAAQREQGRADRKAKDASDNLTADLRILANHKKTEPRR